MAGNPCALTIENASEERIQRAVEAVGPLIVQGLTTRQIAKELKISQSAASRDVRLCKNYWEQRTVQAAEEWRYKATQQYEYVLKELHEQWQLAKAGKKTIKRAPDGTETIQVLPADLKALSAIVATTKELTTLLGLRQADTVQQVAIESTTVNALAPMSADDYLRMIANGGGLPTAAVPSTTAPPRAAQEPAWDVEAAAIEPEEPGPQEHGPQGLQEEPQAHQGQPGPQEPQEQLEEPEGAAGSHRPLEPASGPLSAPAAPAAALEEQLDPQLVASLLEAHQEEPQEQLDPQVVAALLEAHQQPPEAAIQPATTAAPGPARSRQEVAIQPAAAAQQPQVTITGLQRRLARIRRR